MFKSYQICSTGKSKGVLKKNSSEHPNFDVLPKLPAAYITF